MFTAKKLKSDAVAGQALGPGQFLGSSAAEGDTASLSVHWSFWTGLQALAASALKVDSEIPKHPKTEGSL